jgi:hypothetical protein
MKKNYYPMRHHWITNLEIGHLYPTFFQEVVPGDVWSGHSNSVFRLAPLDHPAYMQLKIFTKFFWVPYSKVFPEFPEIMAGTDTTTQFPTINYNPMPIFTAFGIGLSTQQMGEPVNALPIRVYNKIYNDWFRDTEHYSEIHPDNLQLHRIQFPHDDYFGSIKTETVQGEAETIDTSGAEVETADIMASIRRQRLAEKRAKYGERYTDLLLSDFGIRGAGGSIDRAHYIASSQATMGISEVVATATSQGENTGEIRGHGITGKRINFRPRRFKEHGMIMGVTYARPRLQLRQRTDRIWLPKEGKNAYYLPALDVDAWDAISSLEIYNEDATPANFGYLPRYDELRKPRDTIAGNLLSTQGEGYTAHVDIDSVPTVAYLQQVQEYNHMFQDQTSTRLDITAFFDHQIGKRSIVRKKP